MKKTRRLRIILPALLALLLLGACGPKKNCLAEFPPQDMSGYAGLADYTKELSFVDVTVQDIHRLKEDKETFVFVASFNVLQQPHKTFQCAPHTILKVNLHSFQQSFRLLS